MRTEKRKPTIAILLSIITPGLGQIYNGQMIKGVSFYLAASLLQIFILLTGIHYRFYGMVVLFSFGVLSYLFIAGEAFFTARKLKEIPLRAYNKWYYYLLFVIFAIGAGTIVSNLYDIEPLKISSGSMIPTLHMDDRIIINTKYYDNNSLNKGDIIVFKIPNDPSRISVKRVIAVEGDVIESVDKLIYVNGLKLNEPYVQYIDNDIQLHSNSAQDNFGPITIPKGNVFVMGDHRNQSYDSRFLGYVDETTIIGKAIFIYWSEKISRIGMEIK